MIGRSVSPAISCYGLSDDDFDRFGTLMCFYLYRACYDPILIIILSRLQPSILPVQILRIGQMVILSVPGGKCLTYIFFT